MGAFDSVARFFELTLDNVFRFICSLLFAVTALGAHSGDKPIENLAKLLDWLGIPSLWLMPTSNWIAQRENAIGIAAGLMLAIAVIFTAHRWRSRSGSTVLLSFFMLVQAGLGALLSLLIILASMGLITITGISAYLERHRSRRALVWPEIAWRSVFYALQGIFSAALYLFSPLGWLLSAELSDRRGTLSNPLYIKQIKQKSQHPGALPLRSTTV